MRIAVSSDVKVPAKSPNISGKIGNLATRLADSEGEIHRAQQIRYQVFCEEMSAKKNISRFLTKRDHDKHDKICDHLLVIDCAEKNEDLIVGTQRFFVKSSEDQSGTFYSQSEFDVENLAKRYPQQRFMELGRSCILPDYRNKRTMELMWHGTWDYALQKRVDVMVGCASFPANDFESIKPGLSFLAEHALCDDAWDTPALSENSISLREFQSQNLNSKRGLASLPPLIKGYLRLGAKFAGHAVPDPDFGTIDILVVLPVANINPRYVNYYGPDAGKHRN